MPFPFATVATTNRQPFERGGGPYQIGTNLFVIINNGGGGGFLAEIWMSADGGATWAQQDAAHAPAINSIATCAGCSDGTNLYIVSQDSTGSFNGVWIFNSTTLLWHAGHLAPGTAGLSEQVVGVVFRASDAKLVILQQDTTAVQAGARCTYYTFDTVGLTFTAAIACGGTNNADPKNWNAVNAVRGNGITHFVMTASDPVGPPATNCVVYQQPLSDGGVLGALQIVDADPANTDDANNSYYAAAGDGSTVVIGFIPNTTLGVSARVYQGISAAVIAFTLETIAVPAVASVGVGLARGSGVTAFYFAVDDTVNTSFYYAFDNGGGFGTPALAGSTNDVAFGVVFLAALGGFVTLSPLSFVFLFWAVSGGAATTYFAKLAGPVAAGYLTITFGGIKVYSA